MRPFSKDLDQGIATGYYLALSPDVKELSGRYFSDKKLARASLKGYEQTKAQALLDYCKHKAR